MNANPQQEDAVPSHRIQILVAAYPLLRAGLTALLSSQPDFLVVGQAHDPVEALRQLRDTLPAILLVDFSTFGLSWLDKVYGLKAGSQSRVCQTIMLTAAIEKEDTIRLLRHGVRGILSKHSSIELIFKCIRTVHNGDVWIGRNMIASIVETLSSSTHHELRPSPRQFRLTQREQEIVQLVVQGNTNKRIAERLTVSENTVKHHLTNIFDKTGASTRLELAMFAMHHQLVAVA